MKLIFAGTPAFAVPSLRALVHEKHDVYVLTQPSRRQGRKGILTPPPVKEAAEELKLPVLQPDRIEDAVEDLRRIGAHCMVTCAYGQILPKEVLDLFPGGVWNEHASLLPAYRGPAPIARVIMDGCKETGVTIMKTELGLDVGDILLQLKVKIEDKDTCGTLTDKLSYVSALLITEGMRLVERGECIMKKQEEGFTCKKVHHEETDFSRSAEQVSAFIRGLSPSPLAFGRCGETELNFLFAEVVDWDADVPCGTVLSASPKWGLVVKCGSGAVRLTSVQPAGGKKMEDTDFCNGRKLKEGDRFDQPLL